MCHKDFKFLKYGIYIFCKRSTKLFFNNSDGDITTCVIKNHRCSSILSACTFHKKQKPTFRRISSKQCANLKKKQRAEIRIYSPGVPSQCQLRRTSGHDLGCTLINISADRTMNLKRPPCLAGARPCMYSQFGLICISHHIPLSVLSCYSEL